MPTRTVTSHGVTFDERVDNDTFGKGITPPFETWEGDHTALVHVLWAAEHDGLIARRPSPERPLHRALFDRLFGEDSRTVKASENLIDDLRAILDEHETTGGARIPPDQVPAEQRDRQDPIDATASLLSRSRWLAATKAQAVARALREAADEEAEAQASPMTAAVERLLRRAHTHDGRG